MRRDRPFVLSDIQSLTKVDYYCLTEIKYCMSSLYLNSLPVVNTKVVQFLAHFSSSYILILNKLQYILPSQLLVIIMDLIIKNPSNKELSDILYVHLSNQYPELSKTSQQALLKLVYFNHYPEIIYTSNQHLEILFSCRKRRVQQITRELTESGIIQKSTQSCDDDITEECENSLNICINLPSVSNIQFQQTEFLATYIRTQTLCVKGLMLKKALFQDVHDLDNVITIKNYEIGYDDETSDFLKKLNAGDVISFTPSINKPTFKGIKHPLNLKIHTKAETEDNMIFFGEFDCIEEKIVNGHGLRREARFSNIHNINGNIRQKHTWTDIKPNTPNTLAIAKMDEGREVVFKATIIPGDKGFYFKNIHNIMPREEYYNNYGAMQ